MEAIDDLTVYEYTPNQTADIVDRLQDCEIALTNKTVITAEVMEACPGLLYIGVLAIVFFLEENNNDNQKTNAKTEKTQSHISFRWFYSNRRLCKGCL